MPLQHLSSSYISHSPSPPFSYHHHHLHLHHLLLLLQIPNSTTIFVTVERETREREKMMMRAVSAKNPLFGSSPLPSSPAPSNQKIVIPSKSGLVGGFKKRGINGGAMVVVSALQERESGGTLTGLVFQPFEEIKDDRFMVPMDPNVSLAAQRYADECEAAINEQINVEYSASYVYHSLYAYFDRDNVALKGLAKFFKESSEEEREHAEKFMKYQNMRGGRVKLNKLMEPPSEFQHVEKGDALYAMELALGLEKVVNEKLLNLHSVADKNNDPQLQEFIEGEFLSEQVEAIKKIADYVTQLRMVGKGHGVWHFDQMLLEEA